MGDLLRPTLADNAILNKVFGSSITQVVHLKSLGDSPTPSASSALPSSASSASSLSSATESDPTWLEYARILEDEDNSFSHAASPERNLDSPSPFLDSKDRMYLSSSHPLTDKLEYGVCTNCGKPFLTHALAGHIRSCLGRKRSEHADDKKRPMDAAADGKNKDSIKLSANGTAKGAASSGNGGNKGAGSTNGKAAGSINGSTAGSSSGSGGGGGDDNNNNSNGLPKGDKPLKGKKKDTTGKDKEKEGKAGKKRKAESAAEDKQVLKKKKKQPPPKAAPKPKGPVDVERQCGVPLPNGGFCARSLTCKSHSMGAKRNVPGRSQPYDVLLAAYQKKNQMKQAALTSSAQLAEDMELGNGPVDSDAEVESVMEGVQKAFAVPIERKVVMPVRIKNQFFRMREMFASAFARQI